MPGVSTTYGDQPVVSSFRQHGVRRTWAALQVAKALVSSAEVEGLWGYEVSRLTGLRSGTVYPILGRFVRVGWVVSSVEDLAAQRQPGRPPRRFYRPTAHGAQCFRTELAMNAYQGMPNTGELQ